MSRTIAREVRVSTELLALDEAAFVTRITANLPPTPEHRPRTVAHDEAGGEPADAAELEAGGNRCAVG